MQPDEPSLPAYLGILRRRLPIVAGVALLVVAAAIASWLIKSPSYEATAAIAYEDVSHDLSLLGVETFTQRSTEQLANTGAKTASTLAVAEQVKRQLGSDRSARELSNDVTAIVEPGTGIVELTASADDADEAADVANAFAHQTAGAAVALERRRFAAAAGQLQARIRALGGGGAGVRELQRQYARVSSLASVAQPARIVATAKRPDGPAGPGPLFLGVLALVVGLILGGLLAFVREALDRRVHGADEIERELGLPVAARIAGLGRGPAQLEEADADAARMLWRELRAVGAERPRAVLVTSAQRDEGRTTVAAALAWVARPAVLVEADLRRPALAERLGLAPAPGVSDVVTQGADLAAARQDAAGFDCITAGTPTPDPAGALAAPETAAMLRELKDLVVIDGAPLLPVVDARELLDHADAVVLCVRAGGPSREDLRAARRALGAFAGPVVVALTGP